MKTFLNTREKKRHQRSTIDSFRKTVNSPRLHHTTPLGQTQLLPADHSAKGLKTVETERYVFTLVKIEP